LERGKAKTVVVATNVSPPARLDIVQELCREKGVPLYKVADKVRLGASAGLDVGTSCIALRLEMK
jgi:ribosomal protein L7Ae-like RNA K-turn-binding protein